MCRRFYLRAGCQKWSDSSSHELLLPPLRVWDGWLAHAQRLETEIWTGDSVRGSRELSRGQLLRIPSVSLPLPLWIKWSLSLSSSLNFCLGYEWAPSPGLIAGCVSIMMSGEMMMNWVRETKTVTITSPMVTRHDSYSVISISAGKLLSTYMLYSSWLSSSLCSSPGLLASSPLPPLLWCPVLLFALIVNCHLIVSWYHQLPPSSRKHGALGDHNHL